MPNTFVTPKKFYTQSMKIAKKHALALKPNERAAFLKWVSKWLQALGGSDGASQ